MIVKHPEKPKVIIVQNILKEYSDCFFFFQLSSIYCICAIYMRLLQTIIWMLHVTEKRTKNLLIYVELI